MVEIYHKFVDCLSIFFTLLRTIDCAVERGIYGKRPATARPGGICGKVVPAYINLVWRLAPLAEFYAIPTVYIIPIYTLTYA